jgi:hypothetical protein
MRAAKHRFATALSLRGLKNPLVCGGILLNARHAAIGIVLAAEERPVFVFPRSESGRCALAEKQRVARAVGDIRQSQPRQNC